MEPSCVFLFELSKNYERKCENAIHRGIDKDADDVKLVFRKYKEYKVLKGIEKRSTKEKTLS